MKIRIALVGDYNPSITAHQAIPKALEMAARTIGADLAGEWLATAGLAQKGAAHLASYDGIWCVPGSPYDSFDGAMMAIGHARQGGVPFLGTCGGYQHAILEYAHHVLGIAAASHAEISPDGDMPLIAPLSCALIDQGGEIALADGSLIAKYCGTTRLFETYRCSYGLNRAYAGLFDGQAMQITGWDDDGDPRVIELCSHRFFIGTAFQPERSALRGEGHPLITAFVRAAAGFAEAGRAGN